MSGFIGAALPTNGRIEESDQRLNRMDFVAERMFADIWCIGGASFETPWWPRCGGFIGDQSLDIGLLEASWWGEFDQAGGAASRFGFTGITRDANGTPVGTCTVKLFRTADDQLLDTQVSDPSGNFLLNTPYYPDAHYIVAHKSGSPDVDGVTQNTLIGS